jgi:hypothetical protein
VTRGVTGGVISCILSNAQLYDTEDRESDKLELRRRANSSNFVSEDAENNVVAVDETSLAKSEVSSGRMFFS